MLTSASPPSPSPYARLVDQVAAGDQVAFAALYDLLAPYLWACARMAADDERTAQHLATEVFEELWVKAPGLAAGPGCPLARILAAAHGTLRETERRPVRTVLFRMTAGWCRDRV